MLVGLNKNPSGQTTLNFAGGKIKKKNLGIRPTPQPITSSEDESRNMNIGTMFEQQQERNKNKVSS